MLLNRYFIRSLVLLILLLPAAAFAAPAHKLNLFIWSEYIDPAVVSDFEQRFDCKVTIDLYEDEASMMAKLQGGGSALYDVIVPPDHSVPVLAKLNLIRPLRHELIPNRKNIEPKLASPPYDPGNKFTVPYQWGTVGLFVRPAPGTKPASTWGLIFDPKKQPGPLVLLDSDRDMIGAALKYLGHSLNSTNVAHLRAARDLLLQTKKRSKGFVGSVGGKNKVLAREAAAALVYSGDAVRAMTEDPGTFYLIPDEGTQIWVDNLAVPAQAPHPDMAEKFLNFILEPAVGARLAMFNRFATPNKAAKEFIPASDLDNPAIYPPAEKMAKMEFLRSVGKQSRLYDEVWAQVKSK
jgi:spermidine/putrescine transport system substrate-binding protein